MNTDKNTIRCFPFSSVFICVHLWFLSFCFATAARAESHEFVFDASNLSPRPQSVHVSGSFNGWSKAANPMTQDASGVWRISIDLPQGTHQYKFVVDGEKWITDPKADKDLEQDDNYGGKNSG